MNWIEVIHLKPFSASDRETAVAAFHQLTPPPTTSGLRGIMLLKGIDWETELSIMIIWRGVPHRGKKSRLGVQLAAAFSEFGYIHHSAWEHSRHIQLEPSIVISEK